MPWHGEERVVLAEGKRFVGRNSASRGRERKGGRGRMACTLEASRNEGLDDLLLEFSSEEVSIRRQVHEHEGAQLSGFVSFPSRRETELSPCIMVVHTAAGPHEAFIVDKVAKLARLGYIAFAVDMFGEDLDSGSFKEEGRTLLQSRMLAALETSLSLAGVDKNKVAAIGYCFGGTAVLDLARANPALLRGVVSFHGILDHPPALQDVDLRGGPKVLAFNGYSDPFVPAAGKHAFAEEMESKGARWQLHEFGGCVHAFTRPDKTTQEHKEKGFFYDKYAADSSWAMTRAFFESVFSP
uniref:Dienelactone hydrolase domain-containing protein n=1 Tax=Chloropicon primus TaxID=1764295 RepID=A0A7S2T455_9CHLO|mmetsp:Transcript_6416/g.19003  ORF Transcript_6416/g.19003 Transcript_6416/m.19003 type:complete len:297 (+) Transcript_6416:164-1054(+)